MTQPRKPRVLWVVEWVSSQGATAMRIEGSRRVARRVVHTIRTSLGLPARVVRYEATR